MDHHPKWCIPPNSRYILPTQPFLSLDYSQISGYQQYPFGLSVVHQTKTLSNPLSHRPLGQSPEWWKVFVERSPPALPKGKNWDFKGPTKPPVNNRMTGMIIHWDTLIDKIQKLFWVPAAGLLFLAFLLSLSARALPAPDAIRMQTT